jgi:hypothetical protein
MWHYNATWYVMIPSEVIIINGTGQFYHDGKWIMSKLLHHIRYYAENCLKLPNNWTHIEICLLHYFLQLLHRFYSSWIIPRYRRVARHCWRKIESHLCDVRSWALAATKFDENFSGYQPRQMSVWNRRLEGHLSPHLQDQIPDHISFKSLIHLIRRITWRD